MSATTMVDVRVISKCTVKPLSWTPESEKPFYLTPWDLLSLNCEYMQFGLIFPKPKPHDYNMESILDRLKNSLSATLTHFYPLSGRFSNQQPGRVSVVLSDLSGAEFIYAVADTATVSDILNPDDVPHIILGSLFPLDSWAISKQGHTTPLLVVQVTQLIDGIFIACSMNHALADGTSFWHFMNSWSEICRSSPHTSIISQPPVTRRWFSNNQDYNIPASHPEDESMFHFDPSSMHPPEAYRQRVFNFTSKSIACLKAKANLECNTNKISSFQALAALVWRSITRVRGLPPHHPTTCVVAIDCRRRVQPPLSETYFGNSIISEFVSTTVGELLGNNLGWAAQTLHNQIVSYSDNKVRSYLEQPTPYAYSMGDPGFVLFSNSHRFDVYGNDFGWGKPVGVEVGGGVVDGTVNWFSGRNKGSVDLSIYLFSEFMDAVESDNEFMDAVSLAPVRSKDTNRQGITISKM